MILHIVMIYFCLLWLFYVQIDTVISHTGMNKVFCILYDLSISLHLCVPLSILQHHFKVFYCHGNRLVSWWRAATSGSSWSGWRRRCTHGSVASCRWRWTSSTRGSCSSRPRYRTDHDRSAVSLWTFWFHHLHGSLSAATSPLCTVAVL